MKMDELDKEILLHIIELQTCVIEGKDIKTIFRKNMDDFHIQTGADTIAICAKENEQVDFRFIMEDKRLFTHLLKKHLPERKKFKWDSLVEHCHTHFIGNIEYLKINNFHQIFNGFISKKKRPFDAYLLLDDKGKLGFEFPPRKKRARKKQA